MKKIFTLAAAVLASFSLMAQDYATLFSTDFSDASWEGHDTICNGATAEETVNGIFFRCANNSKYYTIADGALTFCDNNSGNNYFMAIPVQNVTDSVIVVLGTVANSQRVNYLFRETNEISTSGVSMSSTAANINTNQSITIRYKMSGDGDEALVMLGRQGSGQKTVIKSITIYTIASAPVADPVTSVTVDGPTEAFVGHKASFSATTDVKADEYKWFVNDVEQEGAETKNFEYTPEAEGTFNIVCQAKNANNTDWVASNTIALVASVRPTISDLVVVDNDIVWDFNNAAAATIAAENQNDTVIFFNAGEWAEGFAADKIAGRGQYYYYSDNKCFQGHVLRFVTSVAGSIVVEFSNTGKPERPYRHLFVNGTDTEYKSNSTAKVTTDAIAVPAGEVVLCGMMENGEDPMTLNMLRIYKITFTKDQETAIENTDAAVKAVKFFQNGQLMIEKNGVIYNAQGAIVK